MWSTKADLGGHRLAPRPQNTRSGEMPPSVGYRLVTIMGKSHVDDTSQGLCPTKPSSLGTAEPIMSAEGGPQWDRLCVCPTPCCP